MDIRFIVHDTELSFEDFVISLMHRRVKQGYPEEILLSFKEDYKAYTWTDGIESILSIFKPLTNKSIQEISISG